MKAWMNISMAILAAVIVLGIIVLVAAFKRKKEGRPLKTDYRSLFFVGICFLGAGATLAITTDNPGFYGMSALGVVYAIAGLANRDKWGGR